MDKVRIDSGTIYKELALTLDTNQYADGDVLAATQELADIFSSGGVGILQSIVLLDGSDQGAALDIVVLKTNVSIGTENAAVSVTDANADEILAIVECAADDYIDMINSQVVVKGSLGIVVETASGATSLFIAAVSRGTGTYAADAITLKFGFLVDEKPD